MSDAELARRCKEAAVGLNLGHRVSVERWREIRDAQDALIMAAERLEKGAESFTWADVDALRREVADGRDSDKYARQGCSDPDVLESIAARIVAALPPRAP